jgi:hypothetical protein
MISDELKSVIIQIITSWQVIGAAVVLILYFSLISYVTRFQRVSVKTREIRVKKPKKAKEQPPPNHEEETDEPEE